MRIIDLPLGARLRRRMGDGSAFVVLVRGRRREPCCGVLVRSERGTLYALWGGTVVVLAPDGLWESK